MSVVTYNNLQLPFALITDFRKTSVMDESGTDRVYTQVDMTVQAVIANPYRDILYLGAPDAIDNANLINNLENYFLEPRKQLSVTFNGTDLIPYNIQGVSSEVDAKNGPVPQDFRLYNLNNNTWFLVWRVQAHYWGNFKTAGGGDVTNQAGNATINNRWSETQIIDDRNFSKVVRQGKCIIRSDNIDGKIVDEVRTDMAVVSVIPGFLRESAEYTTTPDGLALQYTLTDKEQWRMPPSPAFKADGWYQEEVQKASEGVRHGTCYVRLEGDKNTSQVEIARTAILTAASIIRLRTANLVNLGGQQGGLLEFARLKIGKYDNWAEVTLRCMYSVNKARLSGIAGFAGISTATPNSDPQYKPAYLPRGSAGILLQAAVYYDPSLRGVVVDNTGQLTKGKQIGKNTADDQHATPNPLPT